MKISKEFMKTISLKQIALFIIATIAFVTIGFTNIKATPTETEKTNSQQESTCNKSYSYKKLHEKIGSSVPVKLKNVKSIPMIALQTALLAGSIYSKFFAKNEEFSRILDPLLAATTYLTSPTGTTEAIVGAYLADTYIISNLLNIEPIITKQLGCSGFAGILSIFTLLNELKGTEKSTFVVNKEKYAFMFEDAEKRFKTRLENFIKTETLDACVIPQEFYTKFVALQETFKMSHQLKIDEELYTQVKNAMDYQARPSVDMIYYSEDK